MATITGATNEQVFGVKRWLGLNEHPDGDTRLKIGEASTMVNFKITRDGNLKRRPGLKFVAGLRVGGYQIIRDEEAVELGTYIETDSITTYSIATPEQTPGLVTLLTPTVYTFEELGAALPTVASGNFIYAWVERFPYAFNESCLTLTNRGYVLSGYLLTAEPVSQVTKPIAGMWSGYVNGEQRFFVACDGQLWSLYDEANDEYERDIVGGLATDKGVSMFPFAGNCYILNGYNYYKYDANGFNPVTGYIPLVANTIGPLDTDTDDDNINDAASNAGETTSEYVNMLTPDRRVWLSPDGQNNVFQLPEKNITSVIAVTNTTDGEPYPISYIANTTDGQIAFQSPPPKAVNSIEVVYRKQNDLRNQVVGNLYAELYSGTTDTRIFLYGDGTNRAIYSGMDYDLMPNAEYFPDQYMVDVGDSNTPITAMIRHYGTLIAYKPNECWNLEHGVVELATDDLTPAIYCIPVNKALGNIAAGKVHLVNNNPITACGHELYDWSNSSYYTSNLTRDERQARRISDRIHDTLSGFDLSEALLYDDNDHQEFYVVYDGEALVYNYAADAWYKYDNFDAVCMCNFQGELYIGTSDGRVLRVTYEADGDLGHPIIAEWKSGAIDFNAGNMRKYSSMLWVGLKPATGTSVDVCVETDRKNTFREKIVSSEKAKISGQPFMTKTKLKAKKFVYYRLLLSVNDYQPAVTVTDVQIRVRTTGYAK